MYIQFILESLLNKRSHVAFEAAIFFLCLHVVFGHPIYGQRYAIINNRVAKCTCFSQLFKIY